MFSHRSCGVRVALSENLDRLNRAANGRTGREAYAYDELVAELTAALCGAMMGFAPMPKDESVAYLKGGSKN